MSELKFFKYDIDGFDRKSFNEYERENLPQCPKCGSKNTRLLLWGYPSRYHIRNPYIELQGCCIPSKNPKDARCVDCNHSWRRK